MHRPAASDGASGHKAGRVLGGVAIYVSPADVTPG
jgi:hypothetical protein